MGCSREQLLRAITPHVLKPRYGCWKLTVPMLYLLPHQNAGAGPAVPSRPVWIHVQLKAMTRV